MYKFVTMVLYSDQQRCAYWCTAYKNLTIQASVGNFRNAWQKSLQAVWQKRQGPRWFFLPSVVPVAAMSGRLSAVMGLPGIDLTHSFAGVLGDALMRLFRLLACRALPSEFAWPLLLLLLPDMRLRSATFGTGAK